MSLTITAINTAKPREKAYKLFDEKGLFLSVETAGGKLWRLKYRFSGKEKKLALGTYPETGLKVLAGAGAPYAEKHLPLSRKSVLGSAPPRKLRILLSSKAGNIAE